MKPTPPEFRRGYHLKADDANALREAGRSASSGPSSGRMVRGVFGTAQIAEGAVDPSSSRAGGWIGRSGVGGVPAMIDLTPGSATAAIYSFATDDLVAAGEDTVYHTGPEPVAGDVVIQGKFVDGKRVVDWESCPIAGA